jgi:hypothetical protein
MITPSLPCERKKSQPSVIWFPGPRQDSVFAVCSFNWVFLACATHLLAVETPLVRLDANVAVAGDVEAGALDLLDVGLVVVCVDDGLDLGGGDGEARACGPDAVAGAAEDGGLVDVAGANEAIEDGVSVSRCSMGGVMEEEAVPRVNVCCEPWLSATLLSLLVMMTGREMGYLAKT